MHCVDAFRTRQLTRHTSPLDHLSLFSRVMDRILWQFHASFAKPTNIFHPLLPAKLCNKHLVILNVFLHAPFIKQYFVHVSYFGNECCYHWTNLHLFCHNTVRWQNATVDIMIAFGLVFIYPWANEVYSPLQWCLCRGLVSAKCQDRRP